MDKLSTGKRVEVLVRALERIAAGDVTHARFAALARSEAKDALDVFRASATPKAVRA